ALVRGVAVLPVLPLMPGVGRLQVVQEDAVADTILHFAGPAAPARLALELAGPEQLELAGVVAEYRRWLGRPPARRVRLPRWLAALLFRLGDAAGRLGWRPALRSNAAREMVRGATGDPSEWRRLTGTPPRPLAESLAARPPTLQERRSPRLLPRP